MSRSSRPRLRVVKTNPWEPGDYVTERELDLLLAAFFLVGLTVGLLVGWALL